MTKKRARKQKRDHNAQHVLSEMAVTNDRIDELLRAFGKNPTEVRYKGKQEMEKAGIYPSSHLKADLRRIGSVLTASGDMDAFWRVIRSFIFFGRVIGDHPVISKVKNKLRSRKARGIKAAMVQRRREIIKPLILAEIKINPKAVAKRAFGPANELLIANGEEPIGFSTFAELISKIKPPK